MKKLATADSDAMLASVGKQPVVRALQGDILVMVLCALRFRGGGDTERSLSSAGRFLLVESDIFGVVEVKDFIQILPAFKHAQMQKS